MSMLKTFGAITTMVLLSTLAGNTVAAENPQADAVRGGWVADIEGVRHIFILKVLDGVVSGVYCDGDCSEPSHLSLVERGGLTSDGVRFQIHRLDGKTPFVDNAEPAVLGWYPSARAALLWPSP